MRCKAAVLRSMGRPAPFAKSAPLTVEEIDVSPPGPGEVLVQVAAAGLCHSDLLVIEGTRPRPMPMVLGHEAAGVVRELGSGVQGLAVGDPVVFSFVPTCGQCACCADGRAALCEQGAAANGAGILLRGAKRLRDADGQPIHHHLGVSGFSQLAVAAAESLVKLDPDVPLQKAALFGCAVLTGVGAVMNTAQVRPGQSVVVFGLGGVGLAALMGARAAGASPIVAVDLVDSKLSLARELGAHHVFNAGKVDAVQAVRDCTRGGAHFAFESVGSEKVLLQAYQATRRGGTTLALGLPAPDRQLGLPALSLVAEERTLKGSYMGSSVPARDVPRFIALWRAGLLPVEKLHTGTVSLPELNAAFDALARGDAVRQLLTLGAP